MITTALRSALRSARGYAVSGTDGGIVEEVWLDPGEEPTALAVRLADGSRRLLLADDVDTFDPASRSVSVSRGARLLDLGPPHVEHVDAPPSARPVEQPPREDRALWLSVAILYAAVLIIVAVVTGLAFAIPWLLVGRPY